VFRSVLVEKLIQCLFEHAFKTKKVSAREYGQALFSDDRIGLKGMTEVKKEIEKEIESLREKMVNTASQKGINDRSVLRLSQKIDQLHNQLNDLVYTETAGSHNDRAGRSKSFRTEPTYQGKHHQEWEEVNETSSFYSVASAYKLPSPVA
jgi:hypothetical protein